MEEKEISVKKGYLPEKACRIIFAGIWIVLIAWRIYMLVTYCYRYVDDDQAIMWYGTVHFAHGFFPEPCFFGQDYNTMLESLLAVPLYLCGWPLNYALPSVTTVLCIIAFAYCSIDCLKRGRTIAAFMVLFLFAMTAWQWDLLTSIPRAFIPGFPFAVIGAGFMCSPKSGAIKKAVGSCLCMIGTVLTMSAAALLGVALLYHFLNNTKKIKQHIAVVIGLVPGIALLVLEKWYYSVHAGDIITKSGLDFLVKDAFLLSLENLPELLNDTFGCFGTGIILIPAVTLAEAVYFVINKQWKKLVILICTSVGAGFALSFGWMSVYQDGLIMFGKSRLVIFWVFLVLELILLFSYTEKIEEEKEARAFPVVFLAVFSIAFICGKFYAFSGQLKDSESTIYKSGNITIMAVDQLKNQAADIVEIAEASGADVLVTTAYSSAMAYGSAALYYDKPLVFYVPDKDRRVWVYEDMKNRKDAMMLLYSLPVDDNAEFTLLYLDGMTVTSYFEDNYGIVRGGEYKWGIR